MSTEDILMKRASRINGRQSCGLSYQFSFDMLHFRQQPSLQQTSFYPPEFFRAIRGGAMPNINNLAVDLLGIHSIITRGLHMSIECSRRFEQEGYPSPTVKHGFISYVRSLISVLDGHHRVEDELAFPYFKSILLEGPFELLSNQHQTLLPLLEESRSTLDKIESGAPDSEPLKELCLLLKSIEEIWHPHIRIEEDFFTVEKAATAIPQQEHIRLGKLFTEHSQKHSGPDFLVLPFLLYNLPAEQRSAFAEKMPAVVTEELVPIVWKEKWEPMKPFLLP
jgi:hemerythrin-like domain-containing protein